MIPGARGFGRLRQLHEDPGWIAAAASPIGRIGLWIVATALVPAWLRVPVSPVLAGILLAPRWRDELLVLGGLWLLFARLEALALDPAWAALAAAGWVGMAGVTFLLAREYPRLPRLVRRNALLLLHAGIWAALGLAWIVPRTLSMEPAPAGAGVVKALLPFLAWRLGYVVLSGRRGSAARSRFVDHLLYVFPAWGGSNVPYGKGHDHLARHRPATPEDAAAAQLSGLKLLVLMWLWIGVADLVTSGVYGAEPRGVATLLGGRTLGLPRIGAVMGGSAEASLPVAWLLVFVELVYATLRVAITGHAIVGCLRLFGYRVFRSTYRPLLSRTIVDFWSRYYYYFKELLVEFFFLPVYARHFKGRPRLRILAAVLAAACVGNVYYHALRDVRSLVWVGPEEAAARLASHAFYALLLAFGVFVSMLRERERRGRPLPELSPGSARLRALRQIAGVWLFFGIIRIWVVGSPAIHFGDRTRFFFGLFGLG